MKITILTSVFIAYKKVSDELTIITRTPDKLSQEHHFSCNSSPPCYSDWKILDNFLISDKWIKMT
jgi:hypothetical protein